MDLNQQNVLSLGPQTRDDTRVTLYALIDHSAIPGLTKWLNRHGIGWTSLFQGSRDEGALEVAPILVQWCSGGELAVSEKAAEWIFNQAQFSTALSFLNSPEEPAMLARRLALRLDASLPDNVDIVLRYFDGRTFESLCMLLTVEQKQSFLAVAEQWSYVDRRGDIQTVTCEYRNDDDDNVPLNFDASQEAQLIASCEPDQVASMISAVMPLEFHAIVPRTRFDFVVTNCEVAKQFGITATHELALFCCLALEDEKFYLSDYWTNKLAQISLGKTTLTASVDG